MECRPEPFRGRNGFTSEGLLFFNMVTNFRQFIVESLAILLQDREIGYEESAAAQTISIATQSLVSNRIGQSIYRKIGHT